MPFLPNPDFWNKNISLMTSKEKAIKETTYGTSVGTPHRQSDRAFLGKSNANRIEIYIEFTWTAKMWTGGICKSSKA